MTMTNDELKPAVIPVKCPVCNGYGEVGYARVQCRACKGEGYLLVPPKDDDENSKSTN